MAKLADIQIRAWIKQENGLKDAQTVMVFICANRETGTEIPRTVKRTGKAE